MTDLASIDVEPIVGTHASLMIRKRSRSDKNVIQEVFGRRIYDAFLGDLKDKIVFDIGAYIGETALLFKSYGAKCVYCYEPHPLLFDILEKNVKLNKLDNVFCYMQGMSDKEEDKIIKGKPTWIFGSGSTHWADPKVDFANVHLITLNDAIKNVSSDIYLVKIDVEGFEDKIFSSCTRETLSKIKHFIVEIHGKKKLLVMENIFINLGLKVSKYNDYEDPRNKFWTRIALVEVT